MVKRDTIFFLFGKCIYKFTIEKYLPPRPFLCALTCDKRRKERTCFVANKSSLQKNAGSLTQDGTYKNVSSACCDTIITNHPLKRFR